MAENLLMFIRQNKGKLSKRCRTEQFKELTDAEVSSLKAIVNDAFEGLVLQVRAIAMSTLTKKQSGRNSNFLLPDERYVFDREVVVFWGQDGDKRVRCEISQEALDDHFGGDGKDKAEVFRANRRTIEDIARRKYLAGHMEPDASVSNTDG